MAETDGLRGLWWLPQRPEHRVPGILHIPEPDRPMLELFGALIPLRFFSLPYHDVILGEVTHEQPVSLHGCNTRSVQGLSDKLSAFVKIDASIAYIGAHFTDPDAVVLDRLHAEIDGVFDFVRPRGYLSVRRAEDGSEVTVTTTAGPDTLFEVEWRDYKIELWASSTWVSEPFLGATVSISRAARISVISQTGRPLAEIYRILHAVKRFVAFCLGRPLGIDRIYGQTEHVIVKVDTGAEMRDHISLHGLGVHGMRTVGGNSSLPLITLPDLDNRAADVVIRWLESAERLAAVHDLVFAEDEQPPSDATVMFLHFVQAVEAHHRVVSGLSHADPKEYRRKVMPVVVDGIPEDCSDDLRKAIKDRLNYAYELSLRQRLAEMLGGHRIERHILALRDVKEWIDTVVKTRNYLTHFDDGGEEFVSGLYRQLPVLTDQLRGLLHIRLIRDLGFDDEGLRQLIVQHPRFSTISHRRWVNESGEYLRDLAAREEEDAWARDLEAEKITITFKPPADGG